MIEIWIEEDRDDNIITSGKEYLGYNLYYDYKQKWPTYGDEKPRLSHRYFYNMLDEYAYKKYRYYMHRRRSADGVVVKFSPYKYEHNDYVKIWFDNIADSITLGRPEVGKYMYNDFKEKYPTSNMMVNTFYKSLMSLAEQKFGQKPVKFRSSDGVSFVFRK